MGDAREPSGLGEYARGTLKDRIVGAASALLVPVMAGIGAFAWRVLTSEWGPVAFVLGLLAFGLTLWIWRQLELHEPKKLTSLWKRLKGYSRNVSVLRAALLVLALVVMVVLLALNENLSERSMLSGQVVMKEIELSALGKEYEREKGARQQAENTAQALSAGAQASPPIVLREQAAPAQTVVVQQQEESGYIGWGETPTSVSREDEGKKLKVVFPLKNFSKTRVLARINARFETPDGETLAILNREITFGGLQQFEWTSDVSLSPEGDKIFWGTSKRANWTVTLNIAISGGASVVEPYQLVGRLDAETKKLDILK